MRDVHDHTSKAFDAEFSRLRGEIVRMGELASCALDDALNALDARDAAAAERVIAADAEIDRFDEAVNHDALRMLALRQPIARDLREIVACLRIATAIERVGDYAKNIAKRVRALAEVDAVAPAAQLPPFGRQARAAFDEVLQAFRDDDAERAYHVWRSDAELDREHGRVYAELLAHMGTHATDVPACAQLMFVARNLERVGDHATNIAEHVYFAVHGTPPREDRDKDDRSSSIV
jgi:phosphate transport system protein